MCWWLGVGPGDGRRAGAARRAGARVVHLDEAAGDLAWGAFAVDEVAAVVGGVSVVVRARRVVLAPRPVALPWSVPGWGLAGVGTLDQVTEIAGPLVIAGRGAAVVRAAELAVRRGVAVAAVVVSGADGRGLRRLGARVVRGVPLRVEGVGRFGIMQQMPQEDGSGQTHIQTHVSRTGYVGEQRSVEAEAARTDDA